MLSDDELVEQILLGNENVAEELIKRYYTSILRYCRWHCSNLEKAEDLTQETFLRMDSMYFFWPSVFGLTGLPFEVMQMQSAVICGS